MKVVCARCKVMNKVAPEKVTEMVARCGKCKEVLTPEAPGYPLELQPSEFQAQVRASKMPVLLDLWGPGCPPCQRLAPLLKDLALETVGRLKVTKVNVAEQPAAAQAFGVRGVPTLILLKQGREIDRRTGFQTMAQLREFVDPIL